MNAITITLPDERLRQVRQLAQEAGVTPEEWLNASVEAWLTCPGENVTKAADYLLEKNRELYRRLAL